MLLFIFESIGTSELILVGVIALIFLGPRRLPDIARKIGKITAEFRGTANEFKETWQREVDFEEEAKALDPDAIEAETVARDESKRLKLVKSSNDTPEVRAVDPTEFEHLRSGSDAAASGEPTLSDEKDKQNWL
ncbi:MAG: twin-arginine translocase subunit TatB [Pyrinomonadaceae bacterium]|nr:twin-arginine translocase subunit TatB [Pyrinomonadaceae bacterium]